MCTSDQNEKIRQAFGSFEKIYKFSLECPLWTLRHRRSMSALPPKADICADDQDVCFVPEADISHSLHPADVGGSFGVEPIGEWVYLRKGFTWLCARCIADWRTLRRRKDNR